jgi:ribonuclease Z
VISGDTAKSSNLIRAAVDADLMIHEAQAKNIISIAQQVAAEEKDTLLEQTLRDIHRYHRFPVDAAEVANQTKVRLLVLSHLTPPPSGVLAQWAFLRGVSMVRPDGFELGYDGMMIVLPISSREIRISQLR